MKILIYDNYDSFTYNLVHMIQALGYNEVDIFRNDKINIEDIEKYDKIILSPGPGIPEDAGNMMEVIQKYSATKSILGVCLGHQGIAQAFGCKLLNMEKVLHGVDSTIKITSNDYLFNGLPALFKGGHYHSWVIENISDNSPLEAIAENENGLIMAIRHKKYDIRGVQFHPESILTEHGDKIIYNWLNK